MTRYILGLRISIKLSAGKVKIFPHRKTVFIITALAVFLSACDFNKFSKGKVKIPQLSPKYNYRDKEPMGSYIAYRYINNLFPDAWLQTKAESFSKQWYEIDQNKSAYLVVAKHVFLSREDLVFLMSYVENGNTAFISAEYIDQQLMDTLGMEMFTDYSGLVGYNEYRMEKEDTWVTLTDRKISNEKKYGIFWLPFENFFYDYDSAATQVIGHNQHGKANMIALNHGKGKFIFHASPAVFSNHFLLKPGNHQYLEHIFSYLPADTKSVYWDNYYRVHRGTEEFSISDFFKKSESLYPAFLLLLALLLLFIAFGGKRKQRFIPEKIPWANSTVSYTETIGRLYLQKKDNRNISQKMIAYFLEYVRNNYFLNTNQFNSEFASALSRKSGVPEMNVNKLIHLLQEINDSESVSDYKLLELHNSLQAFIKK